VWDAASAFVIGLLYVLMPVFYLAAIAFIVSRRRGDLSRYSLLAASVCIGVPYLHHAFDRASAGHLAQSSPALIIAASAVIAALRASGKRTAASLTAVCWVVLTGVGILPYQPIIQRLRRPNAYIQVPITGDQLWITRSQAGYLNTITRFVDQTLAPDELLFVAPYSPALYPILDRKPPTYDTFLLFPETVDNQHAIIAELETQRVNWALINTSILDDREGELGFANTHPLVWRYLQTEFEIVELAGLPDHEQLYHRVLPAD
jgi:hypothetical protein